MATMIVAARMGGLGQSFVDNEVETLCAMVDSHEIQSSHDLPKEVWKYIFEKGFLGLIIPKEFNGKGFSHFAHAIIVGKLSSASQFLGIAVMVPNSLGPFLEHVDGQTHWCYQY